MGETPGSDIPTADWIDTMVPAPARPYFRLARLDRPIGTWLLLLPCWWGLLMGLGRLPDAVTVAAFAIGAIAMRGAGCTINDLVDRRIDREVARTAGRPLASGAIGVPGALAFLALELLIGLAALMALPRFAWGVAFAVMALVVFYPFAKRLTYWPQVVLGLTFNWGALVGWAAARESIDPPALVLYAAGFFWTLGYDTIYAHQDKADDIKVGVKSSALALGARTRPFLHAVYAVTLVLLAAAGVMAGFGPIYLAAVALSGLQLFWQSRSVDLDDPRDCLEKFRSNRRFGMLVIGAMLADVLVTGPAG